MDAHPLRRQECAQRLGRGERRRLRDGVGRDQRQWSERVDGQVVDDGSVATGQQRGERPRDGEGAEEVDRQVLGDDGGVAEIVVPGDARVVDQEVEGPDPVDGCRDLLAAGDVERDRLDTGVGVVERRTRPGVDSGCAPRQRLVDERVSDASARAGDQYRGAFDARHDDGVLS